LKIWCTVKWVCFQTIRFGASDDSEIEPDLHFTCSRNSEFLMISDFHRSVLYVLRFIHNDQEDHMIAVSFAHYNLLSPLISFEFIGMSRRYCDEDELDDDVTLFDDNYSSDADSESSIKSETKDENDDESKDVTLRLLAIQQKSLTKMNVTFTPRSGRPLHDVEKECLKAKGEMIKVEEDKEDADKESDVEEDLVDERVSSYSSENESIESNEDHISDAEETKSIEDTDQQTAPDVASPANTPHLMTPKEFMTPPDKQDTVSNFETSNIDQPTTSSSFTDITPLEVVPSSIQFPENAETMSKLALTPCTSQQPSSAQESQVEGESRQAAGEPAHKILLNTIKEPLKQKHHYLKEFFQPRVQGSPDLISSTSTTDSTAETKLPALVDVPGVEATSSTSHQDSFVDFTSTYLSDQQKSLKFNSIRLINPSSSTSSTSEVKKMDFKHKLPAGPDVTMASKSDNSRDPHPQNITVGSLEGQSIPPAPVQAPPTSQNSSSNEELLRRRSVDDLQRMVGTLRNELRNMQSMFQQGVANMNSMYAETQRHIQTQHATQNDCVYKIIQRLNAEHDARVKMMMAQNDQLVINFQDLFATTKQSIHTEVINWLSVIKKQGLLTAEQQVKLFELIQTEIGYRFMPRVEECVENTLSSMEKRFIQSVTSSQQLLTDKCVQVITSQEVFNQISERLSSHLINEFSKILPELINNTLVGPMEQVSKNAFISFSNTYQMGVKQLISSAEEKLRIQLDKEDGHLKEIQNTFQQINDHLQNDLINSLTEKNGTKISQMISHNIQQMLSEMIPQLSDSITSQLKISQLSCQNGMIKDEKSLQSIRKTMLEFVEAGDMQQAFFTVLNASNLDLLITLLESIDTSAVFDVNVCKLTQPILLSLIQQLSADLDSKLELKVRVLQETIMCLDPNDSSTSPYIESTISDLNSKLLKVLKTQTTSGSIVKEIRMLSLACRSFTKVF